MFEKILGIAKPILQVILIILIEIILNLLIQGIIWIIVRLSNPDSGTYVSVDYYMSSYNTYIYIIIAVSSALLFLRFFKKEKIQWVEAKFSIKTIVVPLLCGVIPSFILNYSVGNEGVLMSYMEASAYILFSTIISPIIEELVYRDYLYKEINKVAGFGISIVLSSLVFGLMHFEPRQYIYTFFMGILFAYIYHKMGCVASILAHISFNMTATVLPIILLRGKG